MMSTDSDSSPQGDGGGDGGSGGVLDVATLTKEELVSKLQELGVKTYTADKLNNPHLRKAALSKLTRRLEKAGIPFVDSKAAPKETIHFAIASLDILREGEAPKWNQTSVGDLAQLQLQKRDFCLPTGVYKIVIKKIKLDQIKRQLEDVPGVVFIRQVTSEAAGRELLSRPVFIAFYCAPAPIRLNAVSDLSSASDNSSHANKDSCDVSSFFVSWLRVLNRDVSTNPCFTATFLADDGQPARVQLARSLAAEVQKAVGEKVTFSINTLHAVEAWCDSIVRKQQQRQQQGMGGAVVTSVGEGESANGSGHHRGGDDSSSGQAVDDGAEAEVVVERRQGLGEKLTRLEQALNSANLEAFKALLQDPQLLFESSLKSEHVLPCRLEKPHAGDVASRTAMHTIAERGMTLFAVALVEQIQRAVEAQVLGSSNGGTDDSKAEQQQEIEHLTCSLVLKYLLFPLRGNPPTDERQRTQGDLDDAFMTSLHLTSAHGRTDTLQFFLYLMCGAPYPRAYNNRSLQDVARTRGTAQGNAEAKSRVLRVLRQRWYVPLIATATGASSRAAPPAPPEHFDPATYGAEFRAFAGPMTEGEAKAFALFLRKGPNAAAPRPVGSLSSPVTSAATDVTSLQSRFGQLLLANDEGAADGKGTTTSTGTSTSLSTATEQNAGADDSAVDDITSQLAATQMASHQSPATPRAWQRSAPADPDELSMLRKLEAAVTQDMWAELEDLRKADPCRSMEVRGRALARFAGVGWEEYWPFLGCMADLACDDGFQRLQDYLAATQQPFIGGKKTCAWDVTAFVACQDHPSIEQSNSDPLYRDRLRSDLSRRFPRVMKWFAKLEEEQQGTIEQPTQQSPLSRRFQQRSITPTVRSGTPIGARERQLLERHTNVVRSDERATPQSPLSKKNIREKALLERHCQVVWSSEQPFQQSPLSRRFHERNGTPTRDGATPGTSSPLTRPAANTPKASSPALPLRPLTTPRRAYMSPRRRASRSAMRANNRGSSIAALLSRHTPARVSSPVGFRKRAAWINQRSEQEEFDDTFVNAPTQPTRPRCLLPMACARINACGISHICFTHPVLSPAPPENGANREEEEDLREDSTQ